VCPEYFPLLRCLLARAAKTLADSSKPRSTGVTITSPFSAP
jgi:hypothetical protein